jgi:hypothetical protein
MDAAPRVQQINGHYLWLGDYERQVASTINLKIKGDGRLYGVYMKSDSYFEGLGVDEIWQAYIKTKCAQVLASCLDHLIQNQVVELSFLSPEFQ